MGSLGPSLRQGFLLVQDTWSYCSVEDSWSYCTSAFCWTHIMDLVTSALSERFAHCRIHGNQLFLLNLGWVDHIFTSSALCQQDIALALLLRSSVISRKPCNPPD